MHLCYSFGKDWFSTSGFALGVIREPQGLDVEEVHPATSTEHSTDMAFATPLGANEKNEHVR
jgi:hypothetical protein